MVGPINSNRPVHVPQASATDEAASATRGKSQMSVGHRAKEALATRSDMYDVNYDAPNAMGKLASMIAKMEVSAVSVPDAPVEPEGVTVETTITTIVVDPPVEESPPDVLLDLPDDAEIVLDTEADETAAEVILDALAEPEDAAEAPVVADLVPDAEEEEV
ncbi:MAG: hypothetical protein GKR97_02475 [Rhizobiaceae bacterium]|nr:hypothetical protein [Rhizobiaceae bacterium]